MIKFYEGLPGAGKSHGAMENEILPALYFHRIAVTNLEGLNSKYILRYLQIYHRKNRKRLQRQFEKELKHNIKFTRKFFKSEDYEKDAHREFLEERRDLKHKLSIVRKPKFELTKEDIDKLIFVLRDLPENASEYENPEIMGETFNVFKYHSKMPWKNAIFVIDETQKFFSTSNIKALKDDAYYFREWIGEHRHFGYDIIFISQTRKGIDQSILGRIHVLYSYRKQDGIGLDNYFLEEVCSRVSTSGTNQFEVAKTQQRKYSDEVLKCYKSVKAGAQKKMNIDKKAMIFNVKTVVGLIVLIAIIVIPLSVYYVYKNVFDNDNLKFNGIDPQNNSIEIEQEKTAQRVVRDSQGNVVQKNGDIVTETVSTDGNSQEQVITVNHPMLNLFTQNSAYCVSSFHKSDFKFSDETLYNKKNPLNGYYSTIEVVSLNNEYLFSIDLNELVQKYHFEVKVLDECVFTVRFKDTEFDVYPSVSLVSFATPEKAEK